MTAHDTARQAAADHCCPDSDDWHYHSRRCTKSGFEAGVAWGGREARWLRDRLDAVREAATTLRSYDCTEDYVPPEVDVPDDYERGIHDAVGSFLAALAQPVEPEAVECRPDGCEPGDGCRCYPEVKR